MATPLRLRVQKEATERRNKTNSKGKLIKPLFTIEIELPMLLSAKANPVKKTNNHDGLNFVRVMTLSEDILRAIFIDSYTKRTMKPPSARES